MQKTILLLCSILLSYCCFSQAPSPEAYLGYRLGQHFTPHYKIVNYFREVAKDLPGQIKLEQYGTTYEGRPLLLAFIASPENLSRLEDIRRNNLRLAGMLPDGGGTGVVRDGGAGVSHDGGGTGVRDGGAGTVHNGEGSEENAPVIVWLSFNVHGNEPASSEAAMKTLYALVDPSNTQAKAWLQHVIVVIDPCINPDGRDRYVNWYNTTVGLHPDPDPRAREHREPWPQGRTNHYNFDLNRDWAWQTQTETQQRMKQYNNWLPQVHVDYHEQGYNSPYYFAPAAEPYHDVITPWQREFQVEIGKNNAKYFDSRGWLFFTKQEFDLFYPSYGDTYPIYNGAIGMTFEQGGIGAGLAVATLDGDTLTLADRLEHHYTTAVSTIEAASRDARKLVSEFHKYFTGSVAHPTGEFKAYLIKNDPYGDRLSRLESFLQKNSISWAPALIGSFTGLDYETGKTAAFKTVAGDIVINANQPKSNLLRVLFERSSRISDSVTYDITAWSVPFVYGLQAYGLNAYMAEGHLAETDSTAVLAEKVSTTAGLYACAVPWTGMRSARFLATLLRKGVKTRYAEQPFQSGGKTFEKGTLLITTTGNGMLAGRLWSVVAEAAKNAGVPLFPITSGFVEKGADFGSGLVRMIHKPRVALLTGQEVSSQGSGEVWHLFEQELQFPVTLINAEDIARVEWKNYDVLIMPNGYYRELNDKNTAELLKNWVREGGRIIAMESAVEQFAKLEWGIRQKGTDKKDDDKDKKEDDYSALHHYADRQRDEVASSVPGSIYKVELDNSHPLAFGYPDHYYTLKQDDNVYEFIRDGGWNVGVIKKDNYVSGFTGNKAKAKLKDGLIFGVEESGRGEVVFLADDPLFRSFWENGKLLFCNAVFLVGQ